MTLELKNITCERGNRQLFEKLEFALAVGHAIHIRGENGSGKSSLLKIIALLNHPQQGEIFWQGESVYKFPESYVDELLYLGHKGGINLQLTAVQNLNWYLAIQGKADSACNEQYSDVFKLLGLYGFEDIPARQLSAGQRRKILLARLILQEKKIWLLDEPLVSLDSQTIKTLEDLMNRHLEQGGLIIFSSHQDIKLAVDKLAELHLEQFHHTVSSDE